jgi:hypothetical protein
MGEPARLPKLTVPIQIVNAGCSTATRGGLGIATSGHVRSGGAVFEAAGRPEPTPGGRMLEAARLGWSKVAL